MIATVCANQVDANAMAAALDAQLGYPRAGVDVGGGIHVPPAQSVSTHATLPFRNPSSLQYAVPESPEITTKIDAAAVIVPPGATPHVTLPPAAWGIG